MTRPNSPTTAAGDRRNTRSMMVVGMVIAAFLIFASVVALGTTRESPFDANLPNPMGGPARTAPGEATGDISLSGLTVAGVDIQMDDVALDVTYVPSWEVTNPTDSAVTFLVNQPQVREGCCPGPVYAGGELTQAGQAFTILPGEQLLLQFPLQMHAGMDGPHHLVLPLASGNEQAALTVTGNFTASAPA